jgi:magnesium-transporting ATPase (P-type)
VVGVVVYTGSESKLMQNATTPPSKRSLLEQKMNTVLIILFVFMLIVCIVSTIGYRVWRVHKIEYPCLFSSVLKQQ